MTQLMKLSEQYVWYLDKKMSHFGKSQNKNKRKQIFQTGTSLTVKQYNVCKYTVVLIYPLDVSLICLSISSLQVNNVNADNNNNSNNNHSTQKKTLLDIFICRKEIFDSLQKIRIEISISHWSKKQENENNAVLFMDWQRLHPFRNTQQLRLLFHFKH